MNNYWPIRLNWSTGFIVLGLACAPPKAPTQSGSKAVAVGKPQVAETRPVALADLQARETSGLGELPVVAGDGTWRAALLGKGSPHVAKLNNGVYEVKADIGASAPMQCSVFAADVSGGVWLNAVLDRARKSVQMLNVEPQAIEVVGNHVSLDMLGTYLANQKGTKAVGEIKIYILSGSDRGFVCFHDELGYAKTFGASVRSMARSFELLHEPWQVEGIEIYRAEIEGHPVGFDQHYLPKSDPTRLQHPGLKPRWKTCEALRRSVPCELIDASRIRTTW
jgi:hypothetical protein